MGQVQIQVTLRNAREVLTECIGFTLAALAVIANAPHPSLIAATAFFLVGAVVGLFKQLYLDASTETATDDYGLSTARLSHTPLFSGLAALGVAPHLSVVKGTNCL